MPQVKRDDDEAIELTPREELVARRAAALAIERVYIEIGRSVVKRFLWLVGAGAVAAYMLLRKYGLI